MTVTESTDSSNSTRSSGQSSVLGILSRSAEKLRIWRAYSLSKCTGERSLWRTNAISVDSSLFRAATVDLGRSVGAVSELWSLVYARSLGAVGRDHDSGQAFGEEN